MKYSAVPQFIDKAVETIKDIMNVTLAYDDLIPGQKTHNCTNSWSWLSSPGWILQRNSHLDLTLKS